MLFYVAMRTVPILLLMLVLQAAAGQAPKQAPSADVDELLRAGIAASQHGDYRSAIQDFRQVLAMRPEMVEARVGLGAALADAGQFDAAIEEDLRALASTPDKTAARMNLGLAYYKKGDLAHAREQLETVHLATPLDLPAAILLATVYIQM